MVKYVVVYRIGGKDYFASRLCEKMVDWVHDIDRAWIFDTDSEAQELAKKLGASVSTVREIYRFGGIK